MKVFELYFNPKGEEDTVFDSFCYTPANIDEKRLGNLYMAGELKNALPRDYKLLEKLSSKIKDEYYREPKRSPEKALIEGLKNGNKFLENLTKGGDVSWLGNLNFAILSIKDFNFHFTKVENISAFLLRAGKITDIAKSLSYEEIEPYPLKVFGNIVSGKLIEDDIVLVLTKEVVKVFQDENLLNEIALLDVFNEKKLKEILTIKEKNLKENSGIALLISMSKIEPSLKEKLPEIFKFERAKEKFSVKEALSPVKNAFFVFFSFFVKLYNKVFRWFGKRSPLKIKTPALLNLPKVPKLPRLKIPSLKLSLPVKNLILIGLFFIILILGFYLFQYQEKNKIAKLGDEFTKIQLLTRDAEKFLILNNKNQAKSLLFDAQEKTTALLKLLPEGKNASSFKNDILSLNNKIESELLKLSNLTIINEPEVLFDFSQTNLAPQKMVLLGDNIYFFNPLAPDIFRLDIKQKNGQELQIDKKFSFSQPFTSESLIFFTKPDTFYQYSENGELSENKVGLSNDFDFIDFKTFYSNFYLLDKQQHEIMKCSLKECSSWISDKNKEKLKNAVSFVVNGSIWVLEKNGKIDRYHAGLYQETLTIKIFPVIEEAAKISSPWNLPYFYILEPMKNRILLLTKSGEIVKQFQSEKFDNLKDFAVSENGNTIWLLNSLTLYKISY